RALAVSKYTFSSRSWPFSTNCFSASEAGCVGCGSGAGAGGGGCTGTGRSSRGGAGGGGGGVWATASCDFEQPSWSTVSPFGVSGHLSSPSHTPSPSLSSEQPHLSTAQPAGVLGQ